MLFTWLVLAGLLYAIWNGIEAYFRSLDRLFRDDKLESPSQPLLSGTVASDPGVLWRISHRVLAIHQFAMPLFGIIACFGLSIAYSYDQVTRTHCQTPNFMPSISACIGDNAPQRFIWRIVISLMIVQRFYDGFALHGYFKLRTHRQQRHSDTAIFLIHAHSIAWTGEQASLLLLTDVSSSDHELLHQAGFMLFMLFSMVHMLVARMLFIHLLPAPGSRDARRHHFSLMWKNRVMAFNFVVAAIASSAFIAHQNVCIPYRT